MKLIATILLSLIILQFIQAKDLSKNLPEEVTKYMNDNYPKATKVEWIKAKNYNCDTAIYQAHFYNNGMLVTLEITKEGKVLAKETQLKINEIPEALNFYIQGHKIKFVAVVEYHDESPVYILETKYKKHSDFKVFNANGTSVHHIRKHFLLL